MAVNQPVKIFIYAPPHHAAVQKLHYALKTIDTQLPLECYPSIRDLALRLQKPLRGNILGVFLPTDSNDLLELFSLQFMLRNIRIILVLPDRKENTISIGHALKPRYLSYADCDFSDVAAVMAKMLGSPYSCGNYLVN